MHPTGELARSRKLESARKDVFNAIDLFSGRNRAL